MTWRDMNQPRATFCRHIVAVKQRNVMIKTTIVIVESMKRMRGNRARQIARIAQSSIAVDLRLVYNAVNKFISDDKPIANSV